MRAGGACRCVKWAGGGADLLACSEHESNVHIIDSRTWASQARCYGACRPRKLKTLGFGMLCTVIYGLVVSMLA